METTTRPVDNGVNVQALLAARDALSQAPTAARFRWRATCTWVKGTHSRSTIQLRSVTATLEAGMGILGMDTEVRNGFDGIKVTYEIDADAMPDEIRAVVAQSQKRSTVYDILTNPTNVSVEVV